MGRRGYTAEFRQRVLDLVAAGRRVEDIARDLDISDQTVYSWRQQHRVDRGLESGLTTAERAELIGHLHPGWSNRRPPRHCDSDQSGRVWGAFIRCVFTGLVWLGG